jgi:hypothetical protein
MKGFEIHTKTDKDGHLKIDYPVNKKERDVKVFILIDELSDNPDDEITWLKSIESNPVFSFSTEPSENRYSIKDGEPVND